MKIELKKRPKNVTIVEGFPGFGLVGTISTEYLLDHLKAEKIGSVWFSEMNPMIAIHEKKLVDPVGIFYDKKYNLVIIHSVTNIKGVEWKLANAIREIAEKLQAKEIISIEGVGALGKPQGKENLAYYYSPKNSKKFEGVGVGALNEGIVVGVTAALMAKQEKTPISCVFVESQTGLPDSRAAARVIEVLDKYLKLKVDTKPLLDKAVEFEGKLKNLLQKGEQTTKAKEKREMSYLG